MGNKRTFGRVFFTCLIPISSVRGMNNLYLKTDLRPKTYQLFQLRLDCFLTPLTVLNL